MDTLFPWLSAATDRPALRLGERALTQRELAAACAHHVAALAARGVVPGDRVGVWTQPAIETLVAFVAHAAAGYVSVPLDPKLGTNELAHVRSDAAPALCVAADPADRADTIAIEVGSAPSDELARPITGAPALI